MNSEALNSIPAIVGLEAMLCKIRVADVPVFLIAMAIAIPLCAGFIKLAETRVVDLRGFPAWLFTVLLLSFVACAAGRLASPGDGSNG